MSLFGSGVYTRPNRLQKVKNKKYHLDYSKWVLSNINNGLIQSFIVKSQVNWAFYKGDQWLFNEDLETFLVDESGESRNRIRFINNQIRPYVEYIRGAVIRMDMTHRCRSITSQAHDRREYALQKVKYLTKVAQMVPAFKANIKNQYLVGDTEQETEEIFINMYRDQFEEDCNNIVTKIEKDNDIEEFKPKLATHLAVDGIGILCEEERFQNQIWEVQDPCKFFYDTSCRRSDMKDAEFMGCWDYISVADVSEEYPDAPRWIVKKLEDATSFNQSYVSIHNFLGYQNGQNAGKFPRYKVYWRDIERDEWGAVYDDYGYPLLTKINSKDPRYKHTTKDLIPKKELELLKEENDWVYELFCDKVTGEIETNSIYKDVDVIRYAHVVPSEFVSGLDEDIILSFGVRKYDAMYSYDRKYPDWPFKVYTWQYHNGEIMSPIDDLISPQRFVNRVLSMAESQLNNMRGSGVFIDESAVSDEDGMEGIQRDMNQSKPISLNTAGQMNNMISTYSSDARGTLQMFQIAQIMQNISKDMIGGGEALQGQGGAYRASATVAAQNLNQGTTMQEPIFYALDRILVDAYNSMANRGRRIISSNKRKLAFTVGERGSVNINITKEFNVEEFRVYLERVNNPQQEKDIANQTLMGLVSQGIIDKETMAKYWNLSSMADVGYAIREFAAKQIEFARQQAKIQNAQAKKQEIGARAAMTLGNMEQDRNRNDQLALANAEIAADLAKVNPAGKGLQ